MNQAKCTNCGAGLKVQQGDKTCVCSFCQTTNIVENALALGKIEVDVTKDIQTLRTNLATFAEQNSIDEILRVSQKLLDWIPQDFVARYFFAYAKQQQNQPRFLYDFYKEPPIHTQTELEVVVEHIVYKSELRDKRRVLNWFESFGNELVQRYLTVHKEREDLENNYANVPRDVFICFSSYDVEIAEKVVEELEADGNSCWISTRNLRPNDAENYWRNIENAIQKSTMVLVIGSEDSMRSKDVHQEIDLARQHQIIILEFKIDEKPHNTLFRHVFDGIKWVKGTQEVNQSYVNLLQRIYEEKYHSPRPLYDDVASNDFQGLDKNHVEITLEDVDFKRLFFEDNIIDSSDEIIFKNEDYLNDNATDIKIDSKTKDLLISRENKQIASSKYKNSNYKIFFSIIGVGFVITLITFSLGLFDSSRSTADFQSDDNVVVEPEPVIPPVVDIEQTPDIPIESDVDKKEVTSDLNSDLVRTTQIINANEIFSNQTSTFIDATLLSNGDLVSLGYVVGSNLSSSLFLTSYNAERNYNVESHFVNNVFAVQTIFNKDFYQIKQSSNDELIVSYVFSNQQNQSEILELHFETYDFKSSVQIGEGFLSRKSFRFNRFNNFDLAEEYFENNELIGNLVGLLITEDYIYVLTSNSAWHTMYVMNTSFELITYTGLNNSMDNESIFRAKGSSNNDTVTFVTTLIKDEGQVTKNSELISLKESREFALQYNINENIFIERILFMTPLDPFIDQWEQPSRFSWVHKNRFDSSVATEHGVYYIASSREANPTEYLLYDPIYYLGFIDNLSDDVEENFIVDLNMLFYPFILEQGFELFDIAGIYYDPIIDQIVINIALSNKSPLGTIPERARFDAFLTTEGEFVSVIPSTWNNNDSVFNSTYRDYVFEDGTILSIANNTLRIQR
jgi:hypothetical protein